MQEKDTETERVFMSLFSSGLCQQSYSFTSETNSFFNIIQLYSHEKGMKMTTLIWPVLCFVF